jgi:hypothetical protein
MAFEAMAQYYRFAVPAPDVVVYHKLVLVSGIDAVPAAAIPGNTSEQCRVNGLDMSVEKY